MKIGVQFFSAFGMKNWIPAFAGMTRSLMGYMLDDRIKIYGFGSE